jgi:hypothetical protein
MGENKFNNLGEVVGHIKKEGLPSKDEMEAQLDEARGGEQEQNINLKLAEYKNLFNKFKEGSVNADELSRMTKLSDELEKISKGIDPLTL